jgi:hypothetical protein
VINDPAFDPFAAAIDIDGITYIGATTVTDGTYLTESK